VTGLAARVTTRLGTFVLDAAFDTPARGVTGLFGASGSGKSTLLRCIAGLRQADAGRISLNGEVWQDDGTRVFLPPHRRGVGYVSQDADLFPHLPVRDNLRYGESRVAAAARRFTTDDVITWLGIAGLLDRRTFDLSGGERQRVAIARALLSSPNLLLMDEPVSSLDEPSRREVLAYLDRVLADLALPVIYVSHSRSEVSRLADHVVWLADGRVRESGSVAQVLGRLDFAQWWGEGSSTVLEGTVAGHDEDFNLTTITTSLGDFTIHRRPEPPGTSVRLQVNGKDVSLGLAPQERSSILNEVEVTVLEIADLSPSDCLVRLGRESAADTVLFAHITRRSRSHLGLERGLRVFARVKAVAVLD